MRDYFPCTDCRKSFRPSSSRDGQDTISPVVHRAFSLPLVLLSLSRSSVVMDERQTDDGRTDGPSVGKSAERESDLRFAVHKISCCTYFRQTMST